MNKSLPILIAVSILFGSMPLWQKAQEIKPHKQQIANSEAVRITDFLMSNQVTPANEASVNPSISANGRYVAFQSRASNLVSEDTNDGEDIFVRDRLMGTTELISLSTKGIQADRASDIPTISADGRYVAFRSNARNLVEEDTNDFDDIFVRDRELKTTVRISVSSTGDEADGFSYAPSISADGRLVAFESTASNLVIGDTQTCYLGQNCRDIFVHDLHTGITQRVSVSNDGTQGNENSHDAKISADGRFVAFDSMASNLVNGDSNNVTDVFVRDRLCGTTERVSVANNGAEANHYSYGHSISADGRFVAFFTIADNLVSGDTNEEGDIFVRDLVMHTTERVSLTDEGGQANGYYPATISADGRFVVFNSYDSNLICGADILAGIFVRDRLTGTTECVSLADDEIPANDYSGNYSISANGRYVVFDSWATNLVSGDTNDYCTRNDISGLNCTDVFVRDRLLGVTELTSWGIDEVSYPAPDLSSSGAYRDLTITHTGINATLLNQVSWIKQVQDIDERNAPNNTAGIGLYTPYMDFSSNAIRINTKRLPFSVMGSASDDYGDDPGNAFTMFADNAPIPGKIDAPGDLDYFKVNYFNFPIVLRINNLAFGMSPHVRIFDAHASTELFQSQGDEQCNDYLFIPLWGYSINSPVYIEVSDSLSSSSGGSYDISLGVPSASELGCLAGKMIYLPMAQKSGKLIICVKIDK